jgi:hypothetical protein
MRLARMNALSLTSIASELAPTVNLQRTKKGLQLQAFFYFPNRALFE